MEGFNEKAYKDLGYTSEEFEKLRIADFEAVHSEADIQKRLKRITDEGTDIFETKHRTKNGEIRDIFVSSRFILLHGKMFIQSIWRDITEIKQFEKVLKTTNAELQEAYKKLGGAYTQMREWKDRLGMHIHGEETGVLIDKDGQILGITDRVLECTGLNTIELLGSNILDLIRQDSKKRVRKAIRDAWAGIFNQTSFLMIGADPDGREFKAKFMKVSLRNERQIIILMRRSELEGRSAG
jgi:PAS domain S-box-containing protein